VSAFVSARRSARETLLLAERSLRHIPRVPEKLADATIMPIVFIFTFAYVFGSAITVPGGGDYHEYLIGGMFAQGAFQPLQGLAVGVAEDMRTGLVDRLRVLPIGRAAFLTGRNLADLAERVLGSVVFILLGLIVGWRVHTDVWHFLAAFALIQAFAFACSWVGTWVGLIARSGEGAQQMLFMVIFPLMFVSGTFVPIGGMPAVLRTIAEWNPLTAAATACRELFGNPTGAVPDVWSLQHPVITTLIWCAAITALFMPLAIRRYRRIGR
jgi:ABC-2 type transport system permease protein